VPLLTSSRGRGLTLVETVIAMTLAALVGAVLTGALLRSQRFYGAQPQILDVERNLRAIAQLLPAELRGLDAVDGDLIAFSDTAATLKAQRSFGVVCGTPDAPASRLTLANARLSGVRAIDPVRDSVLLYRDGDTLSDADDRWIRARVLAVGTAPCPDGSAGTRLTLAIQADGPDLSGVRSGAPLRAFEVVRYRLYEDGSRTWWLGLQSFGTGWSAASPLAGPLRPRDGLRLAFLDSAGAPAPSATTVHQVRIVAVGRSARAIATEGRRPGPFLDSVATLVLLRNGARP
jgi:hypothetical protein